MKTTQVSILIPQVVNDQILELIATSHRDYEEMVSALLMAGLFAIQIERRLHAGMDAVDLALRACERITYEVGVLDEALFNNSRQH